MNKLKTVIAAALLVGGVGGAVAAEVTYWPADQNKDGFASQTERDRYNAQLYGPMTRERAVPFTTAPPTVTPNEYAQSRAKSEFSYRQADLNRDGIVSQEEWDRYHAQLDSREAPSATATPPEISEYARSRSKGEFSYRDADLNRDGIVSQEEWDRYHQAHPMR